MCGRKVDAPCGVLRHDGAVVATLDAASNDWQRGIFTATF